MSDPPNPGHRKTGAYLFVRKGARRVSIDEVLPGRKRQVPSVAAMLEPVDGRGGVRSLRPRLDPRRLDPRLCFFTQPEAPICDLYRASAAEFAGQTEGIKRILVVSPHARGGRTLTTLNLAAALAEHDRVTVVDLHRRSPGVAAAFGLAEPATIGDALAARRHARGAAIDLTLVTERLSVLAIARDLDPAALPLGPIGDILETVADSSDRVLIDGPPALDGDPILDLARLAEGVLIVVEPGDLATGDYERTVSMFQDWKLVGTIISDRGARRSGGRRGKAAAGR